MSQFVFTPPAPISVAIRGTADRFPVRRVFCVGRNYEAHREASVFYRDATFYSARDVERLLLEAGFSVRSWAQTLARPLAEYGHIEPARPGRGEGAFVVVDAVRPS